MPDLPTFIAPEANPETAYFWEQASVKKFNVKICTDCDQAHWYPRAHCPFCGSANTAWRESAGYGKIYSFSLVSPLKNPYVIAFVTLTDGPTLLTNIIAPNNLDIAIGQSVKIAFAPSEGGMSVPVFVLAADL
ncbi:MAG: OB-fold domain-containing protein [Acidocella sp.]|nr:OB-fold domain-containing protein [Acidocella sp.]